MKVLVVGGTGNISSGIVKSLLAKGDDVSIFVRGQRKDEYPPEVTRIHGSRHDRESYEQTVREGRYDAVIDQIGYNAEDVLSDLRAVEGSDAHLIFCSTVCALGPHVTRVPTPPDEPYRPVSDYGRGKEAAEKALLASGHPVTIIRPSHTYGQLPAFIRQLGFETSFPDKLRRGRPIAVVDTANETHWQSLHVDDAGPAYAYAIQREACFGQIYHMVADEVFTWADYHRICARGIGAPEPELVPVSLDTIVERLSESKAAATRDILAWDGWYANDDLKRDVPEFNPTISLERGFAMQVEWSTSRGYITDADADPWEDELLAAVGSS